MKRSTSTLSGLPGADDSRDAACETGDVRYLPVLDEFLSKLDGKLSRHNEVVSRKLQAWGDLLDLAGWCVALQLGREKPWLNRLAERHLASFDRTVATWHDLLGIMEELADETIHRQDAGVLIWSAINPEKSGVAPTASLTRRESEVMDWLRQGKTSPEIAIILGCSIRTIEKHVANLYRKIGVRNRTAAIWSNL